MNLDIEAIRARCEKATAGPWYMYRCSYVDETGTPGESACAITLDPKECKAGCQGEIVSDTSREECNHMMSVSDAEFIAHAREDIPALLARVDELEASLQSKFSACPGPDAFVVCEDSRAMEGFIHMRSAKACHPHWIVLRSEYDNRLAELREAARKVHRTPCGAHSLYQRSASEFDSCPLCAALLSAEAPK